MASSSSSSVQDVLLGRAQEPHLNLEVLNLEHYLTKCLFGLPDAAEVEDESELLRVLVVSTPGLASRQVCQYQFKKNDIAWICKDCQSDETCVLCNSCWQASDHEGHEVYYYHSQAGGCCDCGDKDAWKPAGFCVRHGHAHPDPLSLVPGDLLHRGGALLKTVVSELLAYADHYSTLFDAGPLDPVDGEEIDQLPLGQVWIVRLHQDDIHSQAQVATQIEVPSCSLSAIYDLCIPPI